MSKGGILSVFSANIRHDVHNAQVQEGKNPDEDAAGDCIHRSPLQAVLDGESHTKVAFYTDCGEEESAVVNGHVEDEARQTAEDERHVPMHVLHHFMHLEGQEEEKEEVRDGEVEEQDVARGGFVPHFLAESIESKDVGWESQDKGNDVDGQSQRSGVILHGGLGLSQLISQGIEMCHIIFRFRREWTQYVQVWSVTQSDPQ